MCPSRPPFVERQVRMEVPTLPTEGQSCWCATRNAELCASLGAPLLTGHGHKGYRPRVARTLREGADVADEGGSSLRSVTRAIHSLEMIAEAGELGVTELGRLLGVHKATASRLAATLADRGLLERNPISDKYRLGLGLVRLAGAPMTSLDLVRTLQPILEELAD